MRRRIAEILTESAAVKTALAENGPFLEAVVNAASRIRKSLLGGGMLYLCGNGGSACDAMHFCEELVARFKRERPGFRAMHFLDPGTLTCWSNDYGFRGVFARQAETFCTARDVLAVFSTSGNSENVLAAVEAAKTRGCWTLAFTGGDGGRLAGAADQSLIVPARATERIQEAHICLVHILCELLENWGED